MSKKSAGSTAVVLSAGIALFSMFFGSGNLIFPPYMGFRAGDHTLTAVLGFSLTAIVLPVLTIVCIERFGSFVTLCQKVGPRFAFLFPILISICIGPGLVLPRNGAVSFEIAVTSFVDKPAVWMRILYALAFYGISYFLSVKPERLSDFLGKLLGPVILVLLFLISAACFIRLPSISAEPAVEYMTHAGIRGFLDGYQTMDILAATQFAGIIALNIKSKGMENRKTIERYTVVAGILAGALLLLIYGALARVGWTSSSLGQTAANGAGVLSNMVGYLFGSFGQVILAVVYVLSCLTTCIGLTCSCSTHFASVFKLEYAWWVRIFTLISMAISLVGLDQIISLSVPVLTIMYPVAIVLLVLGLFDQTFKGHKHVYKMAVLFTAAASIIIVLADQGIYIPGLSQLLFALAPVQELSWLVPAAVGICVGFLIPSKSCS